MDELLEIIQRVVSDLKCSQLKEDEITKVVSLTNKIEEDVKYMLNSKELTQNQKNCFKKAYYDSVKHIRECYLN